MSFWDDVSTFGSGLLEDVGEGAGNLINAVTTSVNPNTVQQPGQPVADNHGNPVTVPQGAATTQPNTVQWLPGVSNTVVMIGTAFALLALTLILTKR